MTKELKVANPLDLLAAEIAMLRVDLGKLAEDIAALLEALDGIR